MIGKRKSPDSEIVIEQMIESSKMLKLKVSPMVNPCRLTKIIKVPPNQIPPLSKSTMEILESLKISRNVPLIHSNKDISSSIPASEKFKYLLGNEKSFPLPSQYQSLIRLFSAIDSTLFYAHYHKTPTTFANIQAGIEQAHRQNCKIQQIQQILTVYPEAYLLSWNLLNKEYLLFINFLTKVEKDDILLRKKYFDERILGIVKKSHEDFLNNNQLKWSSKDSWHPEFNVALLLDIPQAQLPDKPELIVPSINAFISKQFLNNEQKHLAETEIVESSEISEIKGLCPLIAAKIMAKERYIQNKRNELSENSVVKERNKGERLIKLIEILKVLFSTHKTPSMFWNILIDKLKQLQNCNNTRLVEEDLNEIIINCPDFISLIQTNSGPVIRINRQNDLKLVDLKNEMKKKYNLV